MKKIIATAALTACAAVVTAQTVTSANIVGYSKESIDADALVMKSAQFTGSDGLVTLGEAFSGLEYGSKVIVWSGGYTTYTYYGTTYGWLDASYGASDSVEISAGSGVWIQNSSSAVDVLASGEVPDADSVDVTVTSGLNMIANPYPVALALDDIPSSVYGDQAILWNNGYTTYTYYGTDYGWLDASYGPSGTVEIGVGQAFWLNVGSDATLTFDKAY